MSKKKRQTETKTERRKRILAGLADFEEIEKTWTESLQSTSRRIDFREGIVLGLILGILGNLFVQFFYTVFERVIIGNFDVVFWSNLVVCAFAMAIVLYEIIRYRRELKEDYRKIGNASIEHERVKWVITDLKKLLLEEDNKD